VLRQLTTAHELTIERVGRSSEVRVRSDAIAAYTLAGVAGMSMSRSRNKRSTSASPCL
jgi:hypothetical protein